MHQKLLHIVIGLALVAVVGTAVFIQNDDLPDPPSGSVATTTADGTSVVSDDDDDSGKGRDHEEDDAPATSGGSAAPTSGTYTLAQVATHNSGASCWSVINGTVYDLTSWVPNHPGGEQAILRICGTDGSARYNGQHGGASRQAAILAGFKIGVLAP